MVSKIRNFLKTKLWVKLTTLGVVLAVAAYLAWILVITPIVSCGSDVRRIDGQCVGVTDGGVALTPELADVLGKIQRENDRVDKTTADAVSVAYLTPWPKKSSDEELLGSLMRHELQGAYVAQLQANRTATLGQKPLIRLLVANSGDDASHQQQVVSDLLDRVNQPDRLVSVIVTGQTKRGTIDAIDALRRGGVPVVTSRLAGDSLTNLDPAALAQVKGGLARLAPTGSVQAAAAAVALKPTARRALVVRDTNPDDPYLKSIDEGFRNAFQDGTHQVLSPTENYDSRLQGYGNTMRGMLGNICQQKPDVVYFAGRSLGLAAFVEALPRRPCLEQRINIMTGGDAVQFVPLLSRGDQQKHVRDGINANATVEYTGQAHPKAWEASPESFAPAAIDRFRSSCDECFSSIFPGESLEDSGGIMGYDAFVTTVTAIRPVQGGAINSSPDAISQEFKRMHGSDAVAGAGGWISLDNDGVPRNKAVVILQVSSDGALRFVKLSSPLGTPCVPGRSAC